ncbi:MAG: hypothetical protein L6461_06710 [Anaerolineae bacterium]|nr:hypothetical protein [Anaerolineae bacterium]
MYQKGIEVMFNLKFSPSEISAWAERYPADTDHQIESAIAPAVHARRYFTRPEFLATCAWKTPRSKPRVASNPEGFIHAVTQTALSTPDERLRIEVLTLLKGVSWPTASVLLHFGHSDPYPILDFRALWSVGMDVLPVYEFNFWWEYTKFCRMLSKEVGVSMRTLDRALWQYSKENQR